MLNAKVLVSVAALASASLAQTATSTDPACLSSLEEIGKGAPTPAPPLQSYLATVLGTGPHTAPGATTALPDNSLEDPDGYAAYYSSIASALPKSIVPYFKSHAADLMSFGRAHLSDYDAYITNCITTGEAAASLTNALHKMLEPTATVSGTGTYSTTPTPTPTGTNSTTTPTTSASIPTGAAARPTGAIVGVVAIGGLLGAIAF